MAEEIDYYRILGVLDDTEDVVIRAAYRALAQRYHPDKWKGDPAEGLRRMTEINAAYEVLSDPAKRAAWDATRDKNQYDNNDTSDTNGNDSEASSEINQDWKVATKYYPHLKDEEKGLRSISKELGFTFKLILLESKEFSNWQTIASQLETNFLTKYFGSNVEAQRFAKVLILSGNKAAAKELNKAARVLGDVSSAVIKQIEKEFRIVYSVTMTNAINVLRGDSPVHAEICESLIADLGGKVVWQRSAGQFHYERSITSGCMEIVWQRSSGEFHVVLKETNQRFQRAEYFALCDNVARKVISGIY